MDEGASSGSWSPLSQRHQRTSAALTLMCLCLMAASWAWNFYRRGRTIDIDRPFDVPDIELRIDVNQADWPELTLLPDISETMARRIIEHRDEHGPYSQLNQLQDVKGIGPRTLGRIQPYLQPIPPADLAE